MAGRFNSGPNRYAGSLFAATVVIFLGAFAGAGIFAAGGGDPVIALVILGVGLTAIPLLVRLAGSTSSGSASAFNWVFSREARPAEDYTPRYRRSRRAAGGENHPPTLDEIRDIKDELRTWVPSSSPTRRRSLRDEK